MRSLFALLKNTLFFRLMTFALAVLFFLPAWASAPEPLQNVPEDLRELLQEVRVYRAKNLDERTFHLQDEITQKFIDAGQPEDFASLNKIFQEVNVIEFLPDIEAMMTAKDKTVGDQKLISQIISRAKKRNFLSYNELVTSTLAFHYRLETSTWNYQKYNWSSTLLDDRVKYYLLDDHLSFPRLFPFSINIPEAKPHLKADLVRQYIHGIYSYEVVQRATMADGEMKDPVSFFLHDSSHQSLMEKPITEALKKTDSKKRFKKALEIELIKSKLLEARRLSGQGENSLFFPIHEIQGLNLWAVRQQEKMEKEAISLSSLDFKGVKNDSFYLLVLRENADLYKFSDEIINELKNNGVTEALFHRILRRRPGRYSRPNEKILLSIFFDSDLEFQDKNVLREVQDIVERELLTDAWFFTEHLGSQMGSQNLSPNLKWLEREILNFDFRKIKHPNPDLFEYFLLRKDIPQKMSPWFLEEAVYRVKKNDPFVLKLLGNEELTSAEAFLKEKLVSLGHFKHPKWTKFKARLKNKKNCVSSYLSQMLARTRTFLILKK